MYRQINYTGWSLTEPQQMGPRFSTDTETKLFFSLQNKKTSKASTKSPFLNIILQLMHSLTLVFFFFSIFIASGYISPKRF